MTLSEDVDDEVRGVAGPRVKYLPACKGVYLDHVGDVGDALFPCMWSLLNWDLKGLS